MTILTIAGRELRSLFMSPLAWTMLAVMQALHAYLMLVQLQRYLQWQPQLTMLPEAPGITELVIRPLIETAAFVFLTVIPLSTMRLISEERRSGTLTLLLSSPVSAAEIVLGKYLALLAYLGSLLSLIALLAASLLAGADLDWGLLAAALLGLALVMASTGAAGLFMSTITEHPPIAAVSTFGLSMLLWVLAWAGKGDDGGLFAYASLAGHLDSMLLGLIDTRDLGYFALFIGAFLGLSILRLDAYRASA